MGLPEIKPRPDSRMKVMGFTWETVFIQPSRSSSGTKTGARNVAIKMGVWMRKPPELVRRIIAIPIANSVAATLTSTAEPEQPEEVHPAPEHLHAGDERRYGSYCAGCRNPDERDGHVAEDYSLAPRGGEHEALGEPVLEVAGNGEAGERAADGDGLQKDPDVLERRVAPLEVEGGDVGYAGEPSGERRQKEQREQHGGYDQRRVQEEVVDAAPGHGARDGE